MISTNIHIHGDKERVILGKNVSLVNTLLNTSSGHISIGDNTIFGHNCMLLTGTHRFKNGKRISLHGKINKAEKAKKIDTQKNRISINELSDITQYSKIYLKTLIRKNKIPKIGTIKNPIFYKDQIIDWMESKEAPIVGRNIIIGSGCFIGSGVIINGGVTIGDNTIIASGAVVTKDQPSGVIVTGVPGKVKKKM